MDFYKNADVKPLDDWTRTHYSNQIGPDLDGQDVTLVGWMHILRDKGRIKFIILRDEYGTVQITLPQKKVSEEVFETSGTLKPEYALAIRGKVVAAKQVASGAEIIPTGIRIINTAERLPIDVVEGKVDIDLDTRLNHRILDLRKPSVNAIFWIQHSLVRFAREYLEDNRFVEIHTPKIVAEATEGGANLFEVKYFEKQAYLAQSPQFYKQLMLLAGFGRVFEIAPVFRAEKHNTRRHINEYTSFDFEMAWIRDVDDVMKMEENMLHHSFTKTREVMAEQLETLEVELEVPKLPFKRVKYTEAVDLLNEAGKDLSITDDLDPEAERILCDWAEQEHGIAMVFVNEFPRRKRPFYTFPQGQKTMSFDLLFRGLEITTGGRRINEYSMFTEALSRFGMTEAELGSYVDIFKYGCPPHGGFAIGLERITQKILGLANIKEATLFPRDRKRVSP